jgi:hypothetical protein
MTVYDFTNKAGQKYRKLTLDSWITDQAGECPQDKTFTVECMQIDVSPSEAILLRRGMESESGLQYDLLGILGENCNTLVCKDLALYTAIHVSHDPVPKIALPATYALWPALGPIAAGISMRELCTYNRLGFWTQSWLIDNGHNKGSWIMRLDGTGNFSGGW